MHKKLLAISLLSFSVFCISATHTHKQTTDTGTAVCLAPWSSQKASLLELSSTLEQLEQTNTAPSPKQLQSVFTSVIEDLNDDINAQYLHRIKGMKELQTLIPQLPADSTRWTRPVLDFLIDRFERDMNERQDKYVSSRFSPKVAGTIITNLLLSSPRPAMPAQLAKLFDLTLEALDRFRQTDYESSRYDFETMLAIIASCPDLPQAQDRKKIVMDRFSALKAQGQWKHSTDTVGFPSAFFTEQTVRQIPAISQIAEEFTAQIEAPAKTNSYGFKEHPFAQIALLEKMCDALDPTLQQRLVQALMTSENGRASLQDNFYKEGRQIVDRLMPLLPPEHIRQVLTSQYRQILNSPEQTQQGIYQLQTLYNSLEGKPLAQKAVEDTIKELGFVIPAYPTSMKRSELGNEFYVLPYMEKLYPFVPFRKWNPDIPVMSPELFTADSEEQNTQDIAFDQKIRQLLLLNTQILTETSKTAPSVAVLKKQLSDFYSLYRQLLDIYAGNISGYSKTTKDERQLGDWLEELQQQLSQATAQDLPQITATISQTGGFVNTIHSQALWLQHTQMSASSTYSASKPNRLTLYMRQTQIDITNLSSKPLTKEIDGKIEFDNPYLARIVSEIGVISKEDIQNVYVQVRPETISMHVKVRGHHYAELTINTREPEHGGGVTVAFMDPHTLDTERLNRARIIAQALRQSTGLNPQENTTLKQYGGFVTGNLNVNSGISSKTHIMDTAMLALQLFCRSAYIEPRDTGFVKRIVQILLEDNGRLKRSKYFDFLMDRKDSTPAARLKYQRVVHELMNMELKRLDLPATLPAFDQTGQFTIDENFNKIVDQALAAGQIELDNQGIPQKVPGFLQEIKNTLTEKINTTPAATAALAAAISTLQTPLEFKHLDYIGTMPLKQAVLKTTKGTVVVHALFDPDTNRCVFSDAYLRKNNMNTTQEQSRILDIIQEHNPILGRQLVENINEFDIKPFDEHILKYKLQTSQSPYLAPSFTINNINSANKLITGRIKLDRPGIETGSSDILISPSIRPRFEDLAQTKAAAIWVTGAANELSHDANVVRELGINCFQLSGTTDPGNSTITLKKPDGTYVQLKENALVFMFPDENKIFVPELNSSATAQSQFFQTLSQIVMHPFSFENSQQAVNTLEQQLRVFSPKARQQAISLVFGIYMKTGETALEAFLTSNAQHLLEPAIKQELNQLQLAMQEISTQFEHDLAHARTTLEINTLIARSANDLDTIKAASEKIKAIFPAHMREFDNLNTDELLHTLNIKADLAKTNLSPQPLAPDTSTNNSTTQNLTNKWVLTSEELLDNQSPIADIIGNKGAQLVKMNIPGFAVPVWASNGIKQILSKENPDGGPTLWAQIVHLVETESDTYNLLAKISQLKPWQHLPESFMESVKQTYAQKLDSKPVAVRTSGIGEDGALSFAGIGQSFPKVSGIENITSAIVGVIASSGTTKARQYLQATSDERESIDMPVWIHPTVDSKYSAVVFTRNPSSGRKQYIIQGIKGFLEHVVDATVEPDTIVFEKDAQGKFYIAGLPKLGAKSFYEFPHQEDTGAKKVLNLPSEGKTFCLPVPVLKKILEKVTQLDTLYGSLPDYLAGLDLELAVDQDNYVHTVQLRAITTGKMLSSIKPALQTQLDQAA